MNVLVISGNKTQNIVDAIGKCFSEGSIDFQVERDIMNMERYYDKGGYFDRALVVDMGVSIDLEAGDIQGLRERLSKFVSIVQRRSRNHPHIVFICGTETMAEIVFQETMAIAENTIVLLCKPPYTVSFMVEAVSKKLPELEPYSYVTYIKKMAAEAEAEESTEDDEDDGFEVSDFGVLEGAEPAKTGKARGFTVDPSEIGLGQPSDEFGDYGDEGEDAGVELGGSLDDLFPDDIDTSDEDGQGIEDEGEELPGDLGEQDGQGEQGGQGEDIGIEGAGTDPWLGQVGAFPGWGPEQLGDPESSEESGDSEEQGQDGFEDFEAFREEVGEQDEPVEQDETDEGAPVGGAGLDDFGAYENPGEQSAGGLGEEGAEDDWGLGDDGTPAEDEGTEDEGEELSEDWDEPVEQESKSELPELFEATSPEEPGMQGFDDGMYEDEGAAGEQSVQPEPEVRAPEKPIQPQIEPKRQEATPEKHRRLFRGRGNSSSEQMQTGLSGSRMSKAKMAELETVLATFKLRGHIITVMGKPCTGKTTVVSCLADIVEQLGYSVLVGDFDMNGRGLAFYSRQTYDSVHSLDVGRSSVQEAMHNSSAIPSIASIVSPGRHIITTGLAGDLFRAGWSDPEKLSRMCSNAKSQYNVILFEIPWDFGVGEGSKLLYNSDDLVITTGLNTHDLMGLVVGLCNIEDESLANVLWTQSKLLFTRVHGGVDVFGKKVSSISQVMALTDKQVTELLGEEAEYSFRDFKVCGQIPYDGSYDGLWLSNRKYVSDPARRDVYLGVLRKILLSGD